MIFTQEQIQEIHSRLGRLGIKDTDLPPAHEVDGSETIAIVQDSANKKMPLSSILNGMGVNYDEQPTKGSHNLVDSGHLYNAFEDVYDAVDNIQDGANKEYNPAEFSGLGKVYLKKNIVEVGGVEKNVLTQSAFYKEGTQTPNTDTVFVIQYDFDLNGQTIIIPARCMLEFDGGSVVNGRLVSNNTELVGNWSDGDALWGVFYSNGEPLTNHRTRKAEFMYSIEHGYNPRLTNDSARRYPQSIAVTPNNIFVFNINDDTDGGVDVFDRYYNKIKHCSLSLSSHANDATVMGDYILLAGCSDEPDGKGIQKILINEILGADDGDILNVSVMGIDANKKVVCVDYDKDREELAVYRNNYIAIYDSSLNLVKETYIDYTGISSAVGRDVTIQGMVYKNGIVTFYYWNHVLNSENPKGNIIVDFDMANGSYYIRDNFATPYADAEIEGICKDPVDDAIVWGCMGIRDTNGMAAYIAICKCSNIKPITGVTLSRNQGTGYLASSTTVNVYVDANYQRNDGRPFIRDGGQAAPFKSVDEALCMSVFTNSQRVVLKIAAGTYDVGAILVQNTSLVLKGTRSSGTNLTKIRGTFSVCEGTLLLIDTDVEFTRAYQNCGVKAIENSYVFARNGNYTKTNEDVTHALYFDNSDLEINGVRFDGFTNAIGLSNSIVRRFQNITVGNCTRLFLNLNKNVFVEKDFFSNITFEEEATKIINTNTQPFIWCAIDADDFFDVRDLLRARASADDDIISTFAFIICVKGYGMVDGQKVRRGMYYWNSADLISFEGTQNPYDNVIESGTATENIAHSLPADNVRIGIPFFDKTTRKSYINNGNSYVEYDGVVGYVKRSGTIGERPSANYGLYPGFQYFDTTLNRPVFWNGETWVDSIGENHTNELPDLEGRLEMTTDKDGKILSERKQDGTKVEELLQINHLTLGTDALTYLDSVLMEMGYVKQNI